METLSKEVAPIMIRASLAGVNTEQAGRVARSHRGQLRLYDAQELGQGSPGMHDVRQARCVCPGREPVQGTVRRSRPEGARSERS